MLRPYSVGSRLVLIFLARVAALMRKPESLSQTLDKNILRA